MLTDTQIKKLKPTDKCTANKPDTYSDGKGAGLQLQVRTTGTKSWIVRYRLNGKRGNITLGQYPAVSLLQARAEALKIKEKVQQGIDPKQTKIGAITFRMMAEAYHAERNPNNPERKGTKHVVTEGTYRRDFNTYTNDIAPKIAHLDMNSITAPMILGIAEAIISRGALDMAGRAITQITAIYKYARIQGHFDRLPPTEGLLQRLPKKEEKHFARIPFNQLHRLFSDINQSSSELLTKLAFSFICYTAVRTTELRHMTWEEIDWQEKLWRIPAERMKKSRPHIVPLAPQVMHILQTIQKMGLSDEYVFYNSVTGKPFSENVLTSALKRLGWQGKMTGHGFRGVFSTTLHEKRKRSEAIELQLAHAQGNKVSRAYNGAEHLEYRTRMMTEWANMIDEELARSPHGILQIPPL